MTSQSVRTAVKKVTESVALRVYLSAQQQNLTGNAWNKINLNTIDYDLGGNFDTTLFKAVIPVTGLYSISGAIKYTSVIADHRYYIAIYKNNSSIREFPVQASVSEDLGVLCYDEFFLRKDDVIELYGSPQVGGGVDTVDVEPGSKATTLTIRLITKEGIRQ